MERPHNTKAILIIILSIFSKISLSEEFIPINVNTILMNEFQEKIDVTKNKKIVVRPFHMLRLIPRPYPKGKKWGVFFKELHLMRNSVLYVKFDDINGGVSIFVENFKADFGSLILGISGNPRKLLNKEGNNLKLKTSDEYIRSIPIVQVPRPANAGGIEIVGGVEYIKGLMVFSNGMHGGSEGKGGDFVLRFFSTKRKSLTHLKNFISLISFPGAGEKRQIGFLNTYKLNPFYFYKDLKEARHFFRGTSD